MGGYGIADGVPGRHRWEINKIAESASLQRRTTRTHAKGALRGAQGNPVMSGRPRTISAYADSLGIAASALCLVHCILTPVVLSLAIVSAHFLPSEERTHRMLAVIIAAIGGIALANGYRRHRRVRVLCLMTAGLGCIFAGAYWGDRLPSHLAEVGVTLLGSSLMISAHFINHTFCRQCTRCDD
jgi:hypothetical protein